METLAPVSSQIIPKDRHKSYRTNVVLHSKQIAMTEDSNLFFGSSGTLQHVNSLMTNEKKVQMASNQYVFPQPFREAVLPRKITVGTQLLHQLDLQQELSQQIMTAQLTQRSNLSQFQSPRKDLIPASDPKSQFRIVYRVVDQPTQQERRMVNKLSQLRQPRNFDAILKSKADGLLQQRRKTVQEEVTKNEKVVQTYQPMSFITRKRQSEMVQTKTKQPSLSPQDISFSLRTESVRVPQMRHQHIVSPKDLSRLSQKRASLEQQQKQMQGERSNGFVIQNMKIHSKLNSLKSELGLETRNFCLSAKQSQELTNSFQNNAKIKEAHREVTMLQRIMESSQCLDIATGEALIQMNSKYQTFLEEQANEGLTSLQNWFQTQQELKKSLEVTLKSSGRKTRDAARDGPRFYEPSQPRQKTANNTSGIFSHDLIHLKPPGTQGGYHSLETERARQQYTCGIILDPNQQLPSTMPGTAEGRHENQKISELLQRAKQKLGDRITKDATILPLLRYETRNQLQKKINQSVRKFTVNQNPHLAKRVLATNHEAKLPAETIVTQKDHTVNSTATLQQICPSPNLAQEAEVAIIDLSGYRQNVQMDGIDRGLQTSQMSRVYEEQSPLTPKSGFRGSTIHENHHQISTRMMVMGEPESDLKQSIFSVMQIQSIQRSQNQTQEMLSNLEQPEGAIFPLKIKQIKPKQWKAGQAAIPSCYRHLYLQTDDN